MLNNSDDKKRHPARDDNDNNLSHTERQQELPQVLETSFPEEQPVAKEYDTVLHKVVEILRASERARNDDKYLVWKVMREYTDFYVPFKDFEKIPSYETITRCRRMIQNKKGRFLPTDIDVAIKRRVRQNFIKKWATI